MKLWHSAPRFGKFTMCSRLLLIALLALPAAGCANFGYYTQAVKGQFQIYSRSRPIEDVVADARTDARLKDRLKRVLEIRQFASRELALPDNESYRVYADLERPFALWNVFATPELSLKPTEWCFLFIGCVSYRGYFARDDAESFAEELRSAGEDVYVGGVAAYSTLGWFNDPLLNTFVHRPLPELAGLMFHELAHQRLYVKGDTPFNESFAVAVEIEGVHRWLQNNGGANGFADYRNRLKQRDDFIALMLKYRDRLDAAYKSDAADTEKRAAKRRILGELRAEYRQVRAGWNGYTGYDKWFAQDLNNAHFVSVGTYYRLVPAFRALLARSHGDLPAFYRGAEEIGQLPEKERAAALNRLSPSPAPVIR
ncbi:MAG TPA: aminopeptidase [Burkholderiales bacterium]|nr:aminopeptidase [Burkholderiales bacterium]